jgi:hypothetical protein
MTQPEQALLKRRRQILDDETGDAPRFDPSKLEDTWAQKGWAQKDWVHEDAWVRNFIGRLNGLVRNIGGKR